MPRRIPDYPDAFAAWNAVASFGSYFSTFSAIFFFINVVIENFESINIKNYPTFWIFNNYQKK